MSPKLSWQMDSGYSTPSKSQTDQDPTTDPLLSAPSRRACFEYVWKEERRPPRCPKQEASLPSLKRLPHTDCRHRHQGAPFPAWAFCENGDRLASKGSPEPSFGAGLLDLERQASQSESKKDGFLSPWYPRWWGGREEEPAKVARGVNHVASEERSFSLM